MDNSSRNIVKFIAALTGAALLIMAARYYAMSQEVTPPPVAPETAATAAVPAAEMDADITAETGDPAANPDEDIVEEDAELKMGEPSVNLETGGPPEPYNPAPAPEAVPMPNGQ
jgi:hypothetical protein